MKYRQPTKAIITDAGFASRFLPITKTIPKAMLPLGNRPIMQLVVEECVAAGIKEIIIVATHEGKSLYEDYFTNTVPRIRDLLSAQGKLERYEAVQAVLDLPKITVIEQDPSYPYGNGSPIASARQFIDDDEAFIVAYSDDVVFGSSDVQTLVHSYAKHPNAAGIIIAQEMPEEVLSKYGVIRLADEEETTLLNIVEKPKADAPSNLTSYGRYLLTPEVFQYLDPQATGLDGELWTVDAITRMVEAGSKVYVERTEGEWLTTGDPKNYFLAQLKYAVDYEGYADEVRASLK